MFFQRNTGLITWLVLFAAISLAGCRQPEVVHVPSLERNGLMPVAFKNWQPTAAGNIQHVQLRSEDASGKPSEEVVRAKVEPIYVVKLNDTHAVLLTNTQTVDARDQPNNCHACSNYLGAYFFTRDEDGWRLSRRQDHVAEVGVEGNMGKTGIVRLGAQGYAFTAEWGSCWQGYCGTWLVVVGLRPDVATTLAGGIPMSAGNTGAYEDCNAKPATDANEVAVENEHLHECFNVIGDWKPDEEHINVHFRGSIQSIDDHGRRTPIHVIHDNAVYGLKGGKLLLERGKNPVPYF